MEFAADFRWSIRLEIKGIEVRRPAGEEDHDDPLGLVPFAARCFCPQNLGQRESPKSQSADTEATAAGDSVAIEFDPALCTLFKRA